MAINSNRGLFQHFDSLYATCGVCLLKHYLMCISQQLAWMADFVESPDHHLQTILHNFSAAQHGKGPADFEAGACI